MKNWLLSLSIALLSVIVTSCGYDLTRLPSGSSAAKTSVVDISLKGADVELTWTPTSGKTRYEIYRNTKDSLPKEKPIASIPSSEKLHYIDSSVSYGNYYYWVKGCDGEVCSNLSKSPVSIKVSILNDTGINWSKPLVSLKSLDKPSTACVTDTSQALTQDCHEGRDSLPVTKIGGGNDAFDFTKIGKDGKELTIQTSSWSDSGSESSGTRWSCVRDNVTGLFWEVKTNDGIHDSSSDIRKGISNNIHHKDNTYHWGGVTTIGRDFKDASKNMASYTDDWDTLVEGSNKESLCGYNDWRVPTREELRSIVDYGVTKYAIDSNYFPGTAGLTIYLSASPYAKVDPKSNGKVYGWVVYFSNGNDYMYSILDGPYLGAVRLVRGNKSTYNASYSKAKAIGEQKVDGSIVNEWPDNRYNQHGDGTVTDTKTALMWKQCPEGQNGSSCSFHSGVADVYTWEEALKRAEALNKSGFAGYNDWRVPNIKELASLVALDRFSPSINSSVFPKTEKDDFWTSTPSNNINKKSNGDRDGALYVNFDTGGDHYGEESGDKKIYDKLRLRLVRSGM